MSDLTDFLLARIKEDEEQALAAQDHPADGLVEVWTPTQGSVYSGSSVVRAGSPQVLPVAEHVDGWRARHIARHDPARVLAECEAKRLIVRLVGSPDPHTVDETAAGECNECAVLYVMARVYSDHPDYRDEWRP